MNENNNTILEVILNNLLNIQPILDLFKENSFDVIKAFEESLFDQNQLSNYSQISATFISLLIKECQEDKYLLESVFNKIFNSYVKDKHGNQHLETLILMATLFHEQIKLEGDKLLILIINQDSEQCKRVLILIRETLKKKKSQVASQEIQVQVLNTQQQSLVQIQDANNFIDRLIKIVDKKNVSQSKNKKDMNEVLSTDEIKSLAISCLFLLRNSLNKQQQKKVVQLLSKNLYNIEAICCNDKDLISEYLYYLFKNNQDFALKQEKRVMILICKLIDMHMQHIYIEYGSFQYLENQEQQQSSSDEDQMKKEVKNEMNQLNENLFMIEDKLGVKFVPRELLKKNPHMFQICQQVCMVTLYSILQAELVGNSTLLTEYPILIYETILSFAQLSFVEHLPTSDRYQFNDEVYLKAKSFIDFIDQQMDLVAFIKFLYQKLNDIQKRCTLQPKDNIILKLKKKEKLPNEIEVEPSSSSSNDNQILVVQKSDKYTAIGFHIIIEYLVGQYQDTIQDIDIFIKFYSYHLYDPYLFNFSVAALAAISYQFQSNISKDHEQYMPQLTKMLNVNNQEVQFFVIDTLSKIYTVVSKKNSVQMYPYLKDILAFCVKEYMSKDFFNYVVTFTDSIQNLIKLIIEQEGIENFLQEDIIKIEQIFIDMIKQPEQRNLLLQKNHQICLCGLLKIKQKLNLDYSYLQEEIKQISLELADKIHNEGNQIKREDKTLFYRFFKVLTVKALGSQYLFDKIFLLILPQVLQDASVEHCLVLIRKRDYVQNNQDESDDSEDDEMNNNVYNQEEDDEDFEDIEEQESQEEDQQEDQMFGFQDESESESVSSIESDEQEQNLGYYGPAFANQIFVEEALSVLETFCEESQELFLNHKKFDIISLLQKNLLNKFIYEDSLHFIMNILSRIILITEDYFLEQEKKEMINGIESTIIEEGAIEINEMIQIMFMRIIEPFKHDSDQFRIEQISSLCYVLNNLSKRTKMILYQDLFLQANKLLFLFFKIQSSPLILVSFKALYPIFESSPQNSLSDMLNTTSNIISMLTDQIMPKVSEEFLNNYLDRKMFKEKRTIKDINLFEVAMEGLTSFIKLQPEIYKELSPFYLDLFSIKQLQESESFTEQACIFFIQSARYCTKYLSSIEANTMFEILKQLNGYNKYPQKDEFIYLATIRTGLAMVSIHLITTEPEKRGELHQYFEIFIQICHAVNEELIPDAKFIIEFIEKNNIELNEGEKDKIQKFQEKIKE